MPVDHGTIRNPYEFSWHADSETLKVRLDFDNLIRDTVRQMIEMEEQARTEVVVEFLRAKGYYILPPGNSYTK